MVTLELQSAKYQQGFDQATKSLQKFQKDTGDGLRKIADLFASALSVDALIDFGKQTLEASASLDNFSKSAGISVEAISALQFAAKAGGVGADQLNESLKKLNVSISEASGDSTSKAALAFGLLGVNVKNSNGSLKDANAVFAEVADKFAATADGANKTQLAVALFGKAGDALIPTLDKGSAGLKELADQAAAAGAIIDGPTAAAADAFNTKMLLLKTTLVDGIGAQVEKQLLPVLNDLGDQFLDTAHNGEGLKTFADEMAAGFKILISGALTVKQAFSEVGDAIGGALAAVGAALKGNFAEAGRILDDQHANTVKSEAQFIQNLADIWTNNGEDILSPIEVTAKKIGAVLGSLSGAEAAQAALKQLTDLAESLSAEANKLDSGTLAATRYRLAHGELAKALAITGQAGQDAFLKILAAATKIDTTKVSKEIADLNAQLASLGGDTAGGQLVKFNASVKQTEDTLKSLGGQQQIDGQAVINNLRTQTALLAAYNQDQVQASKIQQDYSDAVQAVNDAVANGSKTSLQGEQELQALRAGTLTQLQAIKTQEDAVAAAATNPAITQGVKQFGAALDHLKSQSDAVTTAIRSDFEDAFADNFQKLITGAESFGQAFKNFAQDILSDLTKIASKNLAESIFGGSGPGGGLVSGVAGLFGGQGGGAAPSGGGGLFSGISSLFGKGGGGSSVAQSTDFTGLDSEMFGGGFASGGTMAKGQWGVVGENGPELAMAGSKDLSIIPQMPGSSAPSITNHFVIQSQNGQISRPSQMQTAASVARSVGQASARNNR